jgi:hypothetical protein
MLNKTIFSLTIVTISPIGQTLSLNKNLNNSQARQQYKLEELNHNSRDLKLRTT